MNKVILIGRLTKDAELSTVERRDGSGSMDKLAFTLAVDRRGQAAGADFVRCTVLSRQRESGRSYAALMHEWLVKGKLIGVEGQLRIDSSRANLPDGSVQYRTYAGVIVQNIQLLSPKGAPSPAAAGDGEPAGVGAGAGEDLPF